MKESTIMLASLGQELKTAREKSGLSIDQLSVKIKIDKKFAQEMEQGNFDFLPELYVKAFLREFASIVGLDVEEIMKKYLAGKQGKTLEELQKEELADDQKKQSKQEDKQKKKIIIEESDYGQPTEELNQKGFFSGGRTTILIIAVLIIVAGGVYFGFFHKGDNQIVTETPIEEVINENKQRFETGTESETPSTYQGFTDSLTLSFTATDTVWMLVISDSKDTSDFTYYPKNSGVFKAMQKFEVVLGNARYIDMKLNGSPLQVSLQNPIRKRIVVDKNGIVSER